MKFLLNIFWRKLQKTLRNFVETSIQVWKTGAFSSLSNSGDIVEDISNIKPILMKYIFFFFNNYWYLALVSKYSNYFIQDFRIMCLLFFSCFFIILYMSRIVSISQTSSPIEIRHNESSLYPEYCPNIYSKKYM